MKFWLFSLVSFVRILGGATSALAKPNVLFLLTDDQRADTIGALGNDVIKTPNLDALASGWNNSTPS